LANVWLAQGDQEAAREELAPVLAWFTEGLEAPDLVAARALFGRAAGDLETRSQGPIENSDLHFVKT
jgi:hypothetical protein